MTEQGKKLLNNPPGNPQCSSCGGYYPESPYIKDFGLCRICLTRRVEIPNTSTICIDCYCNYPDDVYVRDLMICKSCLSKRVLGIHNPFREYYQKKIKIKFKRDKCKICGFEIGLQKHHIIPRCCRRREYLLNGVPVHIVNKYRNRVITLCKNCHTLVHDGYISIRGIVLRSNRSGSSASSVEKISYNPNLVMPISESKSNRYVVYEKRHQKRVVHQEPVLDKKTT